MITNMKTKKTYIKPQILSEEVRDEDILLTGSPDIEVIDEKDEVIDSMDDVM